MSNSLVKICSAYCESKSSHYTRLEIKVPQLQLNDSSEVNLPLERVLFQLLIKIHTKL